MADIYNEGAGAADWTGSGDAVTSKEADHLRILDNDAGNTLSGMFVHYGPVDLSTLTSIEVEWELAGDAGANEIAKLQVSVDALGTPTAETTRGGNFARLIDTLDVSTLNGTEYVRLRMRTQTASRTPDLRTYRVTLVPSNVAPNAPTLTNPVGGATIDRTAAQRFAWDFNDPDAGDSQSRYELRYRLVGAATWTTVGKETTSEHHDFAAATFAAGDYEWQARTWDAQGEVGPWAASEFFTAADPPAGPSITDPTSGQTIPTESYTVAWSAAEQDAYQLRRVADNAGSPDTAAVYYDTGRIASATARSRSVAFPTNNRWEHVQVRVERNGLWSTWASVRVEVSWTPPATPTAVVDDTSTPGAIRVQADHGPWPVEVSTSTFTGTGTGTITGPTATPGVTDSHDWRAECVATAANGGTFDVSVDGVVVGQATVGTQFTHEGLAFTINDGPTDYALGDTYTWQTTAVKVSSHDVHVRTVAGTDPYRPADGIRIKAGLAPSSRHVDWELASGVGYAYRIRAWSSSGTSAWSAWTAEPSVTHDLVDGGNADADEPVATLDGGSA